MILTVDIGNSNVVLAFFEGEDIVYNCRLITRKDEENSSKYEQEIKEFFKNNNIKNSDIEGVVLSSVVPEITDIVKESLAFLGVEILLIGDEDVKLGITFQIDNPKQSGSDILMNIIAGKKLFGKNFIVVDMGTATTFDIAGKNGDFIGAVIAPGVRLSCKALSDGCSKLPECVIGLPKIAIGKNTRDAMNAGIYFGHIGVIREITDRIKAEYGHDMKICLTGGMSYKFGQNMDFVDVIDPNLTLKGLRLVWDMNK